MAFSDCATSTMDMLPSADYTVSLSTAWNCSMNTTTPTATPVSYAPPAYGMSCLSMSLGVVSNLTGLAVLASSQTCFRLCRGRHRRAKAPFVLLARFLLLIDLAGQLITGTFALYLHLERRRRLGGLPEQPHAFCGLFGACMVFFGLCPLLLGGAMAAERCAGIAHPFLHAAVATVAHVRLMALLLMTLAFSLAALPLLGVGGYTWQYPGTWCFLRVHGQLSPVQAALALVFTGLGLTALLLSVLCNTASGAVLMLARRTSRFARKTTAKHRHHHASSTGILSLDVEMMTQLAVINVVSCVCWCPFLVSKLF